MQFSFVRPLSVGWLVSGHGAALAAVAPVAQQVAAPGVRGGAAPGHRVPARLGARGVGHP